MDFLERYFSVSPDGGSGFAELGLLVVGIVTGCVVVGICRWLSRKGIVVRVTKRVRA